MAPASQCSRRHLQDHPQPRGSEVDDDQTTNSDFGPTGLHSRDISPETDDTSSRKHVRRSHSALPIPESAKRDVWSRWLLLMNDVPGPGWSIEDEMRHLVEDISKKHPSPPLLVIQQENEDQDNTSSFVPNLTNILSNYLCSAGHPHPKSLIWPTKLRTAMGWRAVLDILPSSANPDIADPKTISDVEARLEALYGSNGEESDESTPPSSGCVSDTVQQECERKAQSSAFAADGIPLEFSITTDILGATSQIPQA